MWCFFESGGASRVPTGILGYNCAVLFCWLLLFVVPLTFVILLDAFKILVGEFWFLIRYIFKGFSQCRVVVGYALQVSPAVTRLTVYRRLQVLPHAKGHVRL